MQFKCHSAMIKMADLITIVSNSNILEYPNSQICISVCTLLRGERRWQKVPVT